MMMYKARTYLPGLIIGPGLMPVPGRCAILFKTSFGAVSSEGKRPGDNALIRIGIPFKARSFAITFVRCPRAAFELAYANYQSGIRIYFVEATGK